MALIKCPECGREISDQAEICINCGIKIAGMENLHEIVKKKEEEMSQEKSSEGTPLVAIFILVIIVISIVIIIGSVLFSWYQSQAPDRARQELRDSLNNLHQIQEEIDELERQIEYNNYIIDKYGK